MLKSVSCLPANTELVKDLKDIVYFIANNRAANDQSASLRSVYNDIRASGIEIDLRSVANIYADVLDLNEKAFDSLEEIEETTGASFRNMVSHVVALNDRYEHKEIGELSSEEWVAEKIANAFYGAHTEKFVNQTDMVAMQTALLRGVQRILGKLPKKPQTEKDYQDIISQALMYDEMGIPNLSGRLNSMRDLFEAMQQEINEYTKVVGVDADATTKAKWSEYVSQLESAAYNLLFTEKEARKILTDTLKEAGFAKNVGGKSIINWNKLAGEINDVTQLRRNVENVLASKGYRPDVVQKVTNALEQEFNDMFAETMMRADKELARREKNIGASKAQTKMEYQKLAELYNLGIFKRAHDKVLFNLIGVDDLTASDITEIENIAKDVAALSRELDGKDYLGSYAFQLLNHKINLIVSKNITNKTKLTRLMGAVDKYFQVLNFGRIANAFNMAQNNVSGLKELHSINTLIVKEIGKSFINDNNVFASVWKDVAQGGIRHGNDNVHLQYRKSFDDQLNANHKSLLKKFVYYVMAPGRAFLSGSDSAIKASLQRKGLMLAMYKALTQNGMPKDDAIKFMNQALYGQSWEDAQKKAKEILEKYKLPVTKNTINRLANDLVIGNLNTGGLINDDLISAAKNAAYNIAGIGLGHVPNNPISRIIDEARRKSSEVESSLVKSGNWNRLAFHRLGQTSINGALIPFIGGIFNWVTLTLQSDYGMGIATGAASGNMTKEINFDSKKKIQESIEDNLKSRAAVARGINGLIFSSAMALLLYGLAQALFDDQEDENGKKKTAYDQMLEKIKGNYVLHKFMMRTTPGPVQLYYSMNTAKNPQTGAMSYATNFFNIGSQFDKSVEIAEAARQYALGNIRGGNAKIGQVIGQMAEVPFWRSSKGYYQIEEAISGKKVGSDFKNPNSFADGLFMGGFLQDLGIYSPYSGTEVLKGIGPKKAEALRSIGIETIEQLKKENIENLFDNDGNAIFSGKEVEQINSSLEEYK